MVSDENPRGGRMIYDRFGSGRKVKPRGSRAATGRLNAPGETSGKSFNYARRFWIKATRLYGARICEQFYIIAPSRGWKIMCRGGKSVETMRTMRTMCVHGGDAICFHTRDERELRRDSSLSLLSRGIDFTVFHIIFHAAFYLWIIISWSYFIIGWKSH